ncbi:MAG TPA: NADP-dependent oxidoreductase [Armatimonadota bacterium]
MKAVRIHEYGGPEVLQYEEAPKPVPNDSEVLIRIHAAAINPVDWKVRKGYLKGHIDHAMPLILGWDLSGIVEEAGVAVTRLRPGDEVYSRPDLARDGAYAEYIVADDSLVALKPTSIDHIHAAGIPLAGMTAWQALFDVAALQPGQRVLVHAAAGGVGSFAVQMAKWKGAFVIGTASARNVDLVRELGADEVVDYTATQFETAVQGVDVVLDTIGGDTQERSWGVMKPGGILVSIVSPPSEDAAKEHNVRSAYHFLDPNAGQLTRIAELVDTGHIRSIVETVFQLADARNAHEMSETGHARGKIVLQVP